MRALTLAFTLAAFALLAACQPSAGGDLTVEHPWAAASPNGATVASGYFTLSNTTSSADRLIGATSPRAPHVQVHEMRMDGAMMQMRPLDGLDIPAHGEVTLSPGGYHLMFDDITAPFSPGEQVEVTLTFQHHAPITANLPVRAGGAGSGM